MLPIAKRDELLPMLLEIHLMLFIPYYRKGLPQNPNKDKMLLDLPDYSFVDGRPTPYGSRQKQRIEKQRYYTAKIISLTEEIDTAERLHQEKLAKQKMLAEQRIKAKLRPKGEKTITS